MSSAEANTVEQLKAAANDLYLKGDYEAAHLTYSQAIEEDSTNPTLFANRAQTDLAMKKFVVLFLQRPLGPSHLTILEDTLMRWQTHRRYVVPPIKPCQCIIEYRHIGCRFRPEVLQGLGPFGDCSTRTIALTIQCV